MDVARRSGHDVAFGFLVGKLHTHTKQVAHINAWTTKYTHTHMTENDQEKKKRTQRHKNGRHTETAGASSVPKSIVRMSKVLMAKGKPKARFSRTGNTSGIMCDT